MRKLIVLGVTGLVVGCTPAHEGASDASASTVESEACDGVSLDPLEDLDAERSDRGAEGLRVLRAEAQASREQFDDLNDQHQGNYSYRTTMVSFTGFRCMTEVTVRQGAVVKRSQQTSGAGADGGVDSQWTEEGEAVGSHTGACHPAATLDALYDECLARALCTDPTQNLIYFSTDEHEVLRSCGAFPLNCEDDCYVGAELDSVTFD